MFEIREVAAVEATGRWTRTALGVASAAATWGGVGLLCVAVCC